LLSTPGTGNLPDAKKPRSSFRHAVSPKERAMPHDHAIIKIGVHRFQKLLDEPHTINLPALGKRNIISPQMSL
jgi:hypothetical protein